VARLVAIRAADTAVEAGAAWKVEAGQHDEMGACDARGFRIASIA